MLDPEKLYSWASVYFDRNGLEPTMRQATRRFKCKIEDIEDAVSDYDGNGYLGIAVGFGSGSTVIEFDHKGEYLIEAY